MEYRVERRNRMRGVLAAEGVDLLLVAPSADLRYLSGLDAHASERPTLLVMTPEYPTTILLPQFEAPLAADLEDVRILTYQETENPYQILAQALDGVASSTIAISDQAWAAVLLGLQGVFTGARFITAARCIRQLRMRKSPDELHLLRMAGGMVDRAFDDLVQLRFAGRTERHIAGDLTRLIASHGLEPAEWGPIVGSGPHSASPHHMTSNREIHEGDALLLDFGGTLEGFQADTTRTVHVGSPSDEFRHVYEIVRQAQEAGVNAVRPGVPAQDVDRATRGVIDAAGYAAFFTHRTGHGLGLEAHEEPYIIEGNDLTLEAGMTFSVEPGVYFPGRFGVRIEDIVAVTDDGVERLNRANRDLVIVH